MEKINVHLTEDDTSRFYSLIFNIDLVQAKGHPSVACNCPGAITLKKVTERPWRTPPVPALAGAKGYVAPRTQVRVIKNHLSVASQINLHSHLPDANPV